MSEDVRKSLRTQGKYNDGKVRKSLEKKQRDSFAAKDSSQTKSSKRNSDGNKCTNNLLGDESESPLKYEEGSDYTFDQLEEVEIPEEIKGRGEIVLTNTENGESRIFYEPHFLHEDEGFEYFDRLYNTINWNTKNIVIHGVEYPQPRLVAWFGPFPYSYSGTTLEPAEMPDVVMEIKEKVEKSLACNGIEASFNSVLINLYRDGKDSVAWHSDDELMLGISPTIASVSLGEVRKFEMRPKRKNYDDRSPSNQTCKYFVHLIHGSLIVMTGAMQDDWQHRVPKEYHDKEPRINLTFRTVYPLEKAPECVPGKEINVETGKKQSYGRNISSKASNCEYKLDDEDFPSLQKDVISAKSNITCNMYDPHKNHNPNLKKCVAREEYWDSEISDNKQNVENAVVTHKNTSSVIENCKSKYNGKNNFNSRKHPEKWPNVEPKCDNVKIPFDEKTVTKKLWCDGYDSTVNGYQENNTVEEKYEMKCHKSVSHSSTNEIQENNFYKEIDQNKVYDRESSLTVKIPQQNVTNQVDLENEKPQNTCHYVDGNSWMDSSAESNLDVKQPAKIALNVDTRVLTNSCVNITQENDLNSEKPSNACYYIAGNSWVNSSEESNLDIKKPIKVALNVDAKEFVPTNIKSSEISQYSDLKLEDAKEFVPFNIKSNEISQYSDLKLEDLINCDINSLEGKDLQDHAQSLKRKVLERFRASNRFERNEIEFLLQITDGSQVDKNQKLISNRICSLVQNNILKNRQSSNVPSSYERSPRQRGFENQGYYPDKGKRYPNQNRNSKTNRNRF